MENRKKKAAHMCCVVGCKNNSLNSHETHFYRFPANKLKEELRKKWINAVRRQNLDGSPWQPSKSSRICSRHFIENKKSEHPLNPSFIPTIFPMEYGVSSSSQSTSKPATDTFERSMKRQSLSTAVDTSQKKSKAVDSIRQEEIDLCADNQVLNIEDSVKDQATQVDFLDESNDCKIFICNRYVYNTNCEAEIQANFPLDERVPKLVKSKAITVIDKGCGTDIIHHDKAVGSDLPGDSISNCNSGFHGVPSIRCNQEMLDLAGVTISIFQLLLKILYEPNNSKVSKENRLLIFLFKMKLGLTFSALGALFNVHRSTASRTFFSVLQYMSQACRNFVRWPSKEVVQATMPDAFKKDYKNCRVIIDCTEIKVEQPSSVEHRVQFYSHYKKGFTVKILVGCTPGGFISFISKFYGGRTTDAQITNNSGFLNYLEPGDLVLADEGFPEIKTALDDSGRGILLVMPPFLHNGHFDPEEVAETYKVATVRIHIERIMQRIKIYRVLSKLTIRMLPYTDDIIFMCCVLVNLQPPIMKESDNE